MLIISILVELTDHSILVEDHVRGIPRFAALLNSNDSFCIFRKFGDEAARILLIKQIELCQLATKLDEINKADAEDKLMEYRLTTIEHDENWDPAQQDLLDKIGDKLTKYCELKSCSVIERNWQVTDDLLLKFTDVRALAEVPTRYHQSVCNWVVDNVPLEEGETSFLSNADDFAMTMRNIQASKQSNLIEDAVETYLTNNPTSILNVWSSDAGGDASLPIIPDTGWRYFQRLMGAQEEKGNAEDAKVVHLSSLRFGILSKISAAFLAVGLILAPVLILFLANLGRVRMAGVVGAFVLVFLVGVFLVVDLTTHEIFIIVVA
jgi:hypothetical protein